MPEARDKEERLREAALREALFYHNAICGQSTENLAGDVVNTAAKFYAWLKG